MPDAAARQFLIELQSSLLKQVGSGRQVPSGELHVTVLHFGFVQETYRQLLEIKPMLEEDRYKQAVQTFIAQLEPELPKDCRLTIEAIAYYGQQSSVIALQLKEDLAFIKAHEASMQCLRDFAQDIGVGEVADIQPQPRSLQVPLSLTPHISLIKGVRDEQSIESIVASHVGKQLNCQLYEYH